MNDQRSAGTRAGDIILDPVVRGSDGLLYAPDVHQSAYEAIVHGSGAVVQSPAVAAGEGGVAVGSDVHGDVVVIPYDGAFDRIVASSSFVLEQLQVSYAQTREQSQGWFRFSLIAAGLGFVLVAIGVIAVIFGQITAGVITAISSAIPDVAAALFFVQAKAANERVDAIQTRLTEARELQAAVDIAETIDDPKSRNKLKAIIVKKALRLEADGKKE